MFYIQQKSVRNCPLPWKLQTHGYYLMFLTSSYFFFGNTMYGSSNIQKLPLITCLLQNTSWKLQTQNAINNTLNPKNFLQVKKANWYICLNMFSHNLYTCRHLLLHFSVASETKEACVFLFRNFPARTYCGAQPGVRTGSSRHCRTWQSYLLHINVNPSGYIPMSS